ncbi:uncharacterized protein LOC141904266 isoform X2 [Tubulanus polymorphus]|uniref:uncharacterized protein LOC141904266 isoform X2 n=1 Tax=Tubulanus polymorphus TaxID=672921 RepID=UPI003DA276BD
MMMMMEPTVDDIQYVQCICPHINSDDIRNDLCYTRNVQLTINRCLDGNYLRKCRPIIKSPSKKEADALLKAINESQLEELDCEKVDDEQLRSFISDCSPSPNKTKGKIINNGSFSSPTLTPGKIVKYPRPPNLKTSTITARDFNNTKTKISAVDHLDNLVGSFLDDLHNERGTIDKTISIKKEPSSSTTAQQSKQILSLNSGIKYNHGDVIELSDSSDDEGSSVRPNDDGEQSSANNAAFSTKRKSSFSLLRSPVKKSKAATINASPQLGVRSLLGSSPRLMARGGFTSHHHNIRPNIVRIGPRLNKAWNHAPNPTRFAQPRVATSLLNSTSAASSRLANKSNGKQRVIATDQNGQNRTDDTTSTGNHLETRHGSDDPTDEKHSDNESVDCGGNKNEKTSQIIETRDEENIVNQTATRLNPPSDDRLKPTSDNSDNDQNSIPPNQRSHVNTNGEKSMTAQPYNTAITNDHPPSEDRIVPSVSGGTKAFDSLNTGQRLTHNNPSSGHNQSAQYNSLNPVLNQEGNKNSFVNNWNSQQNWNNQNQSGGNWKRNECYSQNSWQNQNQNYANEYPDTNYQDDTEYQGNEFGNAEEHPKTYDTWVHKSNPWNTEDGYDDGGYENFEDGGNAWEDDLLDGASSQPTTEEDATDEWSDYNSAITTSASQITTTTIGSSSQNSTASSGAVKSRSKKTAEQLALEKQEKLHKQEERERKKAAKEQEKLDKQKQRELKLQEKEQKKLEKAKEKAAKKAVQEANKNSKPGECTKLMVVMIDSGLINGSSLAPALLGTLQGASVNYRVQDLPVPNSITWRRQVPSTEVDQYGRVNNRTAENDENEAIVFIPIDEFVDLVYNAVNPTGSPSLSTFVKQVRQNAGNKNLTIIVKDIERYFRSVKTVQQREYRQAVLNVENPESQQNNKKTMFKVANVDITTQITRVQLEEALVDVQVNTGCNVKFVETEDAVAKTVLQYTKAVAEITFKPINAAIPEKANYSYKIYQCEGAPEC